MPVAELTWTEGSEDAGLDESGGDRTAVKDNLVRVGLAVPGTRH